MSILTKKPEIDPERVYLCVAGHVSKAGLFAYGARVRANDPAVAASPTHWIEDGATDREITDHVIRHFGVNALPPLKGN